MKQLLLLGCLLLGAACADDDNSANGTVDCQDEGPIRVRILQEIAPEIAAFELNFWTDGVDSTTFFDLVSGVPTAYCSFAQADGCSFAWEARNGGVLLEDYAAFCIIADPLAAGDYTLRVYCEAGNCDRFEFLAD